MVDRYSSAISSSVHDKIPGATTGKFCSTVTEREIENECVREEVCVCMCMCVCERERERDREKKGQTHFYVQLMNQVYSRHVRKQVSQS